MSLLSHFLQCGFHFQTADINEIIMIHINFDTPLFIDMNRLPHEPKRYVLAMSCHTILYID